MVSVEVTSVLVVVEHVVSTLVDVEQVDVQVVFTDVDVLHVEVLVVSMEVVVEHVVSVEVTCVIDVVEQDVEVDE